MATSYRKQAVLAGVQTELGGNAFTHDSVLVTVTDTMKNGSLLVGDTEAALADVADVDGIIDDPAFDDGLYTVGDVILVSVGKRSLIANTAVLAFTDGTVADDVTDLTTLTALVDAGVVFKSAETTFTRN